MAKPEYSKFNLSDASAYDDKATENKKSEEKEMKKQKLLTRFSLAFALLLLVAAVFVGCGEPEKNANEDFSVTNAEEIGEGQYSFYFVATFADKSTKNYRVSTDCETVGDALSELGLIAGKMSEFGLTVETVCSVTVDFGADSSYWAIYVDDDYSMVGVDSIKCADIKKVELRFERF